MNGTEYCWLNVKLTYLEFQLFLSVSVISFLILLIIEWEDPKVERQERKLNGK